SFKKTKLSAWEKCLDGQLKGGSCDPALPQFKIDDAAAKATAIIGNDNSCPAPILFGAPPDGLGFAQNCHFEGGSLPDEQGCFGRPVTSSTALAQCLLCWKEAELDELLHILYPCPNPAPVPNGCDLDCG